MRIVFLAVVMAITVTLLMLGCSHASRDHVVETVECYQYETGTFAVKQGVTCCAVATDKCAKQVGYFVGRVTKKGDVIQGMRGCKLEPQGLRTNVKKPVDGGAKEE